MTVRHLTRAELEAGLEAIRNSPRDNGAVELIVSRPQPGVREVLDQALLDPGAGLVGDSWGMRVAAPDPETQLNVMNARVIALIAQDRAALAAGRRSALSSIWISRDDNLPPGTQLEIGSAVIEVSAEPHTGCGKFVAAIRRRRDEVRQLAARPAAAPARHQRARRPGGRGVRRRLARKCV